MNSNGYLIPANTKNGALIFSIFYMSDIILVSSGLGTSLILFFIFPLETTLLTIIALLPGLICTFLVLPIPNYHNVLTVIKNAMSFFDERRVFIWKGWCIYDKQEGEK